MKIERGFEIFLGKKIVSVDTSCINAVVFKTDSGESITIDCDDQHQGIGVIQVSSQSLVNSEVTKT